MFVEEQMEEGSRLCDRYAHHEKDLIAFAREENKMDETNIYQESNKKILPIVDGMLEDNMLPGSKLEGLEYIEDFVKRVESGQHGLLLCEHYSNFDLPGLHYVLRKWGGEAGKDLAERLVAISGMKLNEDNPIVSAWAEAFSRIIIYPSRSIASIKDSELRAAEEAKSRKINIPSHLPI